MASKEALEAYMARGRERMKAALAAQPFRGAPSFEDLLEIGEAALRHLIEDEPKELVAEEAPEPAEAPDAPHIDPPDNVVAIKQDA